MADFPPWPHACAKSSGAPSEVDAFFDSIERPLASKYGELAVREGCVGPLKRATLAATPVDSLAQRATATASVLPDPVRYPASAANDGVLGTLYWPGPWSKTTQSGCN